jgi:hypothetical protein
MENSFQTSFIPKKIITSTVPEKEPKSFFSIISIFLLIISILASGGLYLYKTYLIKQQETLSASLIKTRDSFEKDTIDELEFFNRRAESARKILDSHIVLSPMFKLLGEITIPSVQYTNFEQQVNDKGFLVNIEGLARDYRSIALQADMFNSIKGSYFKNVLFSDLQKDKSNNISFNLKFTIDPELLSYEKNISDLNKESINTNINSNPSNIPIVSPNTQPSVETQPLKDNSEATVQ